MQSGGDDLGTSLNRGTPTRDTTQGGMSQEKRLFFPRTLTIIFLLGAIDSTRIISNGPTFRYAVVVPLMILVLLLDIQNAGDLPTPKKGGLFWIATYGLWLVSVWFYALITATWSNDTGVYLIPGLLLVALPLIADVPRRSQVGKTLELFFALAVLCFCGAAVADIFATPQGNPPYVLSHERFFLAVLVVSLPRFRFSRITKIAVCATAVYSFVHYPSATVVTVALTVAGFLAINRLKVSPFKKIFAILMIVAGVVLVSTNQNVREAFYAAFGRVDNTETRFLLWSQATDILADSPLWGGAGSIPITATAYINGTFQPVPLHNSILSMTVVSGFIAVFLFLGSLMVLTFQSLDRVNFTSRSQASYFIPTVVAAFVSLSVNPSLDSLAESVSFYAILAMASLSQSNMGLQDSVLPKH